MSEAFAPPEHAEPQASHGRTAAGIALMVVGGVWAAVLSLALVVDVVLIVSGLDAEIEGNTPVRMVLGVVFIAANALVLYGGNELRRAGNMGMARAACILACIPCLGPCYLLGIPFGIWGLVVLSKPEVSDAFAARKWGD